MEGLKALLTPIAGDSIKWANKQTKKSATISNLLATAKFYIKGFLPDYRHTAHPCNSSDCVTEH